MPTRVLIVDDSASVRTHIRSVLVAESLFDEFAEAPDGLAAFQMMVHSPPDLVICDLVMPRVDGMKLLALVASRPDLTGIPIVLLTGRNDPEHKAEMIDRGASDYLTKPFHDRELVARVRVHHRLRQLQNELRAANLKLAELATKDALTGLTNRRALDEKLGEEIRRHQRYKMPLAVVMLDVDHFKRVNDTHGHAMGDAVLRGVARVLASGVRSVDVVARYGGEEFVLLLPQTGAAPARLVADRLRASFAGTSHVLGDATVRCTASFGVATLDERALYGSAQSALSAADQALYRAKAGGRDRVESDE